MVISSVNSTNSFVAKNSVQKKVNQETSNQDNKSTQTLAKTAATQPVKEQIKMNSDTQAAFNSQVTSKVDGRVGSHVSVKV